MNKKLEKLLSKSKEMADELKEKEQAKAKIDEEIDKIQMKELKSFLVSNNMVLNSEFFDLMVLVKQILDSGVGIGELKELTGTESNAENDSKKNTAVPSEKKITEEIGKDEK